MSVFSLSRDASAMKKAYLIGFTIIILFGAAKWRFEADLTEMHRKAYFHGAKLNLTLRQQIGQGAFIAALSGFRTLVADILWIQAHSEWMNTRWEKMQTLFNDVTALQPRNVMFWDLASWHMGYNASNFAINNPAQPRLALRRKAQMDYFKIAEDFLLRGITYNPDRYTLFDRLGILYRDKFTDHCKAAVYFDKAAQFPDSPSYEKRFAAYELSWCPGKEREAYERLVKLYKMGEQEHLPTLLLRLKIMQDQLNIPPSERVYHPEEKQ